MKDNTFTFEKKKRMRTFSSVLSYFVDINHAKEFNYQTFPPRFNHRIEDRCVPKFSSRINWSIYTFLFRIYVMFHIFEYHSDRKLWVPPPPPPTPRQPSFDFLPFSNFMLLTSLLGKKVLFLFAGFSKSFSKISIQS